MAVKIPRWSGRPTGRSCRRIQRRDDLGDSARRRRGVEPGRHLVQNHFQVLADRPGIAGTLRPDHQRRKHHIRIGRRQTQPTVSGQEAPARQLVGVEVVSARRSGRRRADLQRLGNDPFLRPATPTHRTGDHFDMTENLSRGLH